MSRYQSQSQISGVFKNVLNIEHKSNAPTCENSENSKKGKWKFVVIT